MIDIEQLASPIEGGLVSGRNLRQDSAIDSKYHLIKDARSDARAAERRYVQQPELGDESRAQWKVVYKTALEILDSESKDIEVCAWLIEASIRLHGFAGLSDSLALLNNLIDRYWDELFPEADEDGLETKVAAIGGLNGYEGNGTLISPILSVPLTFDGHEGLALWQYQAALDLEKLEDENVKESRIAQGAISLKDFQNAVSETGKDHFIQLDKSLAQAIENYAQLTAKLEEKCGADAPPSSNIKNALQNYQDQLRQVAQHVLRTQVVEAQENDSTTSETTDSNNTNGAIRSREAALNKLLEVADYFQAAEPHSPLPYVLQRAVRWGRMPLPELIKEMISDEQALRSVFDLTGIEN